MRDRFVYFDLGNVLVKFDHAIASRQLAQLAGCTFDEAQFALYDSGLEIQYETGLLSSPQFASEINRQLNVTLPMDQILEAVSAIFEPNLSILPAMQHIKKSGVRIGLLSNTCQGHWEWVKRRSWATVHGWFELLVLSYEAKLMKPDTAIYKYCEQQCGCSGSQIFFTDDRADNIAAAAACNWSVYQFGTPEGLINAFDRWVADAH